jgi:cbb3-type cytochrome oxidase maturation protein
MTVLFVVLPLATLLSGIAAIAFLWATRSGQFDDLSTPAVRLLCDELKEKRPTLGPARTQALRETNPTDAKLAQTQNHHVERQFVHKPRKS